MSPPFLAFGAVGNYRPSLWNLHLDDIGHFDGVGHSKKFTRPISADRPLRAVYIHHGKIFSRCRERTIFNGGDSRVFVQAARDAERGTLPRPNEIARDGRGIRPYFPFKICLNKYTSLRMADEMRRAALPKLVTAFRNYRACGNKPIRTRLSHSRIRGFHKKWSDYSGFFERGSDRPWIGANDFIRVSPPRGRLQRAAFIYLASPSRAQVRATGLTFRSNSRIWNELSSFRRF